MKNFLLALIVGLFIIAGVIISITDKACAISPQEIVALTNVHRVLNQATPLQPDPLLTKAAQAKANDMAAKQYFSHVTPTGLYPWSFIKDQGYHYQSAGENLGVYFTDTNSLVQAWMKSPGHKANLVNPRFTKTGVGITKGVYKGYQTEYVVQFFALPVMTNQ